jgi:hypothetical protein
MGAGVVPTPAVVTPHIWWSQGTPVPDPIAVDIVVDVDADGTWLLSSVCQRRDDSGGSRRGGDSHLTR